MLTGQIYDAPDGCRGFDCDFKLTAPLAAAFYAHGYRFVRRYIRRAQRNAYDMDEAEAELILAAKLGISPVQHYEPGPWTPSGANGIAYGGSAAMEMVKIGFPPGAPCGCDVEAVKSGTSPQLVINYMKNWCSASTTAGFFPDMYVGDSCGLNPDQLYHALPVTRYEASYNLNTDRYPAERGVCMRQHVAKRPDDYPPGVTFLIQTDICQTDAKGGKAKIFGPPGWTGL